MSRSSSAARATSDAPVPRDSNTCPRCGSHYRDDELERDPARLPALRPPLSVAGARADRAARRPRDVRRSRGRARSADPLGVLRPARLHRAAGGGRGVDRARRRDGRRLGQDRAQGCQLAVMDFSFMGGSMGSVVGEKFVPRLRDCRRAQYAACLRHGLRRSADAGGNPLPHAASEDGLRGRGAARRACALSS